ncbi:MAG: SRPBCC family protein [Rhodobacter sp.]|nr:SRPBCC family protein [Rhodobacter sp.]
MPANSFHLIAHWRVEATIEEVAAILTDAERLPDWWGDVYLDVKITDPGDENGIGRTVAIRSRGKLPYELNWTARLVSSKRPHGWVIAATGDLQGRGEWTLTQNGPTAEISYDWQVEAEKPILRLLSPLLKPLFAWNHRWAMAKGLDGLKAELKRRRAEGS